jgi:hypothetical protein
VVGSSVHFLLFDPKALQLKPSQLPAITLPIAPCECVISFHPQHSLLLWCVGTAAQAGRIACVRCSDGGTVSAPQHPCPALAAPSASLSCAALDDLACIAIASSNGALVTAKLSHDLQHGIDLAVLLPAAASASLAAADVQATGKKRTKQQQQQQQQDGLVCITAVQPCCVAVAWSGCASRPPAAAVYDCSFGSCRCLCTLETY